MISPDFAENEMLKSGGRLTGKTVTFLKAMKLSADAVFFFRRFGSDDV